MKATGNSSAGTQINAGAMRARVTVQARSTSQDSQGQQVATWATFVSRRAEIIRTPGKEVWASQERNGRIPTTFRLRFVDGILPSMRLLCGSKVYNVLSAIDPTQRREETIITAEELVGQLP